MLKWVLQYKRKRYVAPITREAMRILFLLCFCVPMWAQTTYNVRGVVYDSSSLKTLPGATVQINDSTGTLVTGKTTNESGLYLLPNIPLGKYTVKISYIGYKAQSFGLTLSGKGGNKKVQDVLLREDATLMKEATVVGQLPEMTVIDDTTVYNADAFSLPPGAMVKDLVKKLPGIVVDDNGKITHNGKAVTQILVDGKEFFGRDGSMVMENIPAEIVDKVKAYDKQSDLARITGVDDGEEQTVLDLEVKKDKKRGWFGQVGGGYGLPKDRYDARVMVNHFKDVQKFSVVGNANNTNGNGLSPNQNLAGSLNLENEKLELNGGITGRFSQSESASWSNSQNFENKNAAYSNRESASNGKNSNFTTNWRLEWRPDSLTNIQLRPEFSIGTSTSSSRSRSATFNDNPYNEVADPLAQFDEISRAIKVNRNANGNSNDNDNISGRLSLQFNRRLSKPGRNITLNLNGGINETAGNSSSYSQIDYYQRLAYTGGDSIYHKVQYDDNQNKGHNVSTRLSYTEPIAQGHYLQFSYQFTYRFQDRDRTVASIFDPYVEYYGLNIDDFEGHQDWATRDTAQCNYVTNKYFNHDIRIQYRLTQTKWRVTVGVNLQPQRNVVNYTKGFKHYDVARNVFNWSPTLDARYRFSKQESLQARYSGASDQPSITDLIPDTLSNANPLNIRLGNPELLPSFTHNMRLEYQKNITDKQMSFHAGANFRFTQNAIASMTYYNNETGGRVTKPVNIDGNWNLNGNFNFNTAFTDQRFRVNSNTTLGHTNSVGYVYRTLENGQVSPVSGLREGETVKNKVRSDNVRENLRFSFRNDWIEASASGNIYYNHSRATETSASNLDTWGFGYGASVIMNFFDKKLNFSTDLNVNNRRGYSDASMNITQWIWNAQISYTFLKKRNATVTVRWNDLLDQRDMVNRSISATSRTDSDADRISSYGMLSFIYRFNAFGGRSNRRSRNDNPEGFENQPPRGERGNFGGEGPRGGFEGGGGGPGGGPGGRF